MKTLSLALLAASLRAGPIVDPSFELGTGWTSTDSAFGSSYCDIGTCGTGGGTAGPRTGNSWIWFGGEPAVGQTAVLEQSGITIPLGTTGINFYLRIGVADSGLSLSFKVDGTQLFAITDADAPAYTGYTLVSLNPGAFADGGNHTLRFDYTDAASLQDGVNVSLDDISIVTVSVPEPQAMHLALSGLALLGAGLLRRRS